MYHKLIFHLLQFFLFVMLMLLFLIFYHHLLLGHLLGKIFSLLDKSFLLKVYNLLLFPLILLGILHFLGDCYLFLYSINLILVSPKVF